MTPYPASGLACPVPPHDPAPIGGPGPAGAGAITSGANASAVSDASADSADSATWYLVVCKPRQEAVAEQHLQRQGYTVYCPRLQSRRRRQGVWQDRLEPLFPRYLFVRVDPGRQSLGPIRSTRGALGLVRFGSDPARIPAVVIDRLRALEDARTGARPDPQRLLQPGEAVQVREGPLAGLEGIVTCDDGAQRVVLLLAFLGQANRITVRRDWLTRCAA